MSHMSPQDRQMDEGFWHQFWRDFPAAADYFSPAVLAMQRYFGVGSKEILRSIGEAFGKKAAEKFEGMEIKDIVSELSGMWQKMEVGRLDVVGNDPLTLMVSDCMICGQLAGTGGMFECAFHEGFLQSVLNNSLGKKVELHQEANFEGQAGTWCRRFVTDAKI